MTRYIHVLLYSLVTLLIAVPSLDADDDFRVLRQQLDGYAKVIPGKRFLFPDAVVVQVCLLPAVYSSRRCCPQAFPCPTLLLYNCLRVQLFALPSGVVT